MFTCSFSPIELHLSHSRVSERQVVSIDPADVKQLRALDTEDGKLKRRRGERKMTIDTPEEINRRTAWPAPRFQDALLANAYSLLKRIRPLESKRGRRPHRDEIRADRRLPD